MTGPLVLDAEFDTEQLAAIVEAVELWSDATDARFAPEIRIGAVQCGEPFAIEAVQAPDCSVGQKVTLADGRTGRVLGATDPDAHWIAVASWLEGDRFRDTVAHELGHYLLLGHGDGIMAQGRQRQSSQVASATVSEFCGLWGC